MTSPLPRRSIRTDSEAVAGYRRAFVENGLWTQERSDAYSDEEVIRTVQGMMNGLARIGAGMQRIATTFMASLGDAMKKARNAKR